MVDIIEGDHVTYSRIVQTRNLVLGAGGGTVTSITEDTLTLLDWETNQTVTLSLGTVYKTETGFSSSKLTPEFSELLVVARVID